MFFKHNVGILKFSLWSHNGLNPILRSQITTPQVAYTYGALLIFFYTTLEKRSSLGTTTQAF
jgi:hypothetical protein